jgi:metal-dependent amidase/aminoacylase/carboxypeptidase family protein
MRISAPSMGLDYDLSGTIQKLSDGLKAIKPKLSMAVSDAAVALNVKPSVRTTQNSVGINKAGNTVNQNIEINNTVKTSDSQVGKQAAKQMDKSGRDITKEVQRGLAYGRA